MSEYLAGIGFYDENKRTRKNVVRNTTFYDSEREGYGSYNVAEKVISCALFDFSIAERFLYYFPRKWFELKLERYYDAIQEAYEFIKSQINEENKGGDYSDYVITLLIEKYKVKDDDVALIISSHRLTNLVEYYVPIVKKRYILRQQARLARKLYYVTRDYGIIDIEQEIQDLGLIGSDEDKKESFMDLEAFYKEKNINTEQYPLGIPFLDEALTTDKTLQGGIQLGQLVLVSGDFETGKTSLVVQMLENLSKSNKTYLFSFEFPTHNHIISRNKAFKNMLERNMVTEKQIQHIKENMAIIDEGTDIQDIKSRIISLSISGVKFFAIDSQMCIENEELSGTGEQEESSKFKILQRVAQKYNVLIILITQISKTDNTSPLGSKKGAYFASIMIRIENVFDTQTKEIIPTKKRVVIQKNKQTGKIKSYEVEFDRETRYFLSHTTHSNTSTATTQTYIPKSVKQKISSRIEPTEIVYKYKMPLTL